MDGRAASPAGVGTARPTGGGRAAGSVIVIVATCFGSMISMFNSTLVNVMIPPIGRQLHASASGLEWVSALYTLVYGALLLLGGGLGSKYGRRATFLAGSVVFVAGSALCAAAPDIGVLLIGRAVQAIGVAVMLPQSLAILVTEFVAPSARARAVGAWAGIASLGLAAGPVLGGVIISFASWRVGFVLSIALGIATFALGSHGISRQRHGRSPHVARIDYLGAALSALTLLALVYGLMQITDGHTGSPITYAAFLAAALALAAFLASQYLRVRRTGAALMPLALWRSRHLVAANTAGLAYFFLFYGLLYFYSIDLQQARGYSGLVTGLLFLPMMLLVAIVGPLAGWLAARWTPSTVLSIGMALGALGSLLLAIEPARSGVLDLEWRLAVVGIASGLMSSSMSNLAVSSVDRVHASTASAIHSTCRQIGATLGVAVLGIVITIGAAPGAGKNIAALGAAMDSGLGRAMAVTAALMAAATAAVLALTVRRPTRWR